MIDSAPGFFELMERVRSWLLGTAGGQTWPALQTALSTSFDTVITTLLKSGPVPPRVLEQLRVNKAAALSIVDKLSLFGPINFERYRGVHPVLVTLLDENVAHLRSTFGRDVAARAVKDALLPLVRRPRGQPRKVASSVVQQAKGLHAGGKTWAQIGRELGIPASRIRTAVQNDFPPQKESR